MEGELYNFISVWFLIIIALSYCYGIGKIISKGKTRLIFFVPIMSLFLVIPLNLSSIHLGGITGFCIGWLANFKLLLFAFGKGPLNPSISLIQFLSLAGLPIKIQNEKNPIPEKFHKSIPNYGIKLLLLAVMIRVHEYSEFMHPKVILVLYCLHMYIFLELILAMMAGLARAMLNIELEPQFNEPYLSTSLQDFWGRRWNIMATSILRPTVYEPLYKKCETTLGREWAPFPAVLGTFAVSALMHELLFYYLGRVKPTLEITSFFLLHGVSVVAEVLLKKMANGRWRLPVWMSRPLTVGFVMVTGFWLFFPPLLRCKADVRAFEEYAALSAFLKNGGHGSSS